MVGEWLSMPIPKIRNFIDRKIRIKSSSEGLEQDSREKNNLTLVIEG